MWRRVIPCSVCLLSLWYWLVMPGHAAQPFGLPECVVDLASAAVLNAPTLEAMIPLVEPSGASPHPQSEMLFIVSKYYLERSRGLLVLSRDNPEQRPHLLTDRCAPYPEALPHIRAYFADLTPEQQQALVRYQGFIWPRQERPPARIENMARIPGGLFTQGDGHKVMMEAFAIDINEVTNAQYRQFIDAKGYTTRELWSEAGWNWIRNTDRQQPSYWENAQLNVPAQPVVGVSWYEADTYCRWAGKVLPTEPQWEKACRGDDQRTFPWGNAPLEQATASDRSSNVQEQFLPPAAVGSAPQAQSPYGVHDLAGNVLEWTQTARSSQQLVLCGGSGNAQSRTVGCGVRYTLLPGIAANFVGFRCVSTAP